MRLLLAEDEVELANALSAVLKHKTILLTLFTTASTHTTMQLHKIMTA